MKTSGFKAGRSSPPPKPDTQALATRETETPPAETPPLGSGYADPEYRDARAELERQRQPNAQSQDPSRKWKLDGLVGALVEASQSLGPCGFDADRILTKVERHRPNVALPRDLAESAYDGAFVGADQAAYRGDSDVSKVPGLMPSSGEARGRLLYVNGVGKTVASTSENMRHLADKLQMEIIAVHSASQSLAADLMGAACDRLQIGYNPVVDTLSQSLYQQLRDGDAPIHVLAHSRGGLIAARALCALKNRLVLDDGYSISDAESLMSRLRVQAVGAPRMSFPDGPRYKHFVNVEDVFAHGWQRSPSIRSERSGKDCEVITFDQRGDGSIRARHGLVACYLEQVTLHFAL